MKKRKNRKKREKFLIILLKALCVSAVLSICFGIFLSNYLDNTIREQCSVQLRDNISNIQGYVMRTQKQYKGELCMQELSNCLALYTYYDIVIDDPLGTHNGQNIQITPLYSPDCHCVAEIIDEDNNVVASNQQRLMSMFSFGKEDKDNGFYVCENDWIKIPEVTELYKTYNNYILVNDKKNWVEMSMTSAYVNKKKRTFIPHEGYMTVYSIDNIYDIKDEKEVMSKKISITIDDDDYELIEVNQGIKSDYPIYAIFGFQGELGEKEFIKDHLFRRDESAVGGYHYNDDIYICDGNKNVIIGGKEYTLHVSMAVNTKEPQIVKLFWKWVLCFAALATLIALLYAWRRNVKNKAQYAFEDYQRALTNNLAHDLKTPLAVIGGYAENLIEMRKENGGEKELRYLASIMDNVAYTDSIIAKTLRLSETEQAKELNKVKVDIKALAEKLAEKYKAALEERGIELTVTGGGEITADEDTLISAAENLISNAVKYTRDDGTIKITADKKRLAVINDVAENVDTKDLTMPFVKGDKARSDKSSSGLGLAIASAAAERNGFGLKVSCKDKRFTAEIIFR
jgi:nitrogen-specific signal transduction histidine kinase